MRKHKDTLRLTEKESEIMSMLWETDGMFVREMLERYPEPKPHVNTVSTTVRILEEKGYVGHEQVGASYRYHALLPASAFAGKSFARMIKTFFMGSASAAVSALVEQEQISVEELKEIINMIENKEN